MQERRSLEQEVALLSHKPPLAPYPDPLLQQIPTLAGSMHACMTHLRAVDKEYRGVHANAVSFSASVEKKFRGAQTQIHAHAHDIAALKSANERLEAQNARLAAQVSELGGALKSVLNQVALTNQMVAQSHSQGQAVQGRVVGMESGMAQVLAQVGSLGREVHEHRAAGASVPPVKVTLRVDPRCVVPEPEARGTS